jgi:hypothetical protein
MVSLIYQCDGNGKISKVAEYTTEPKQALINYIEQYLRKNWNTADYPKHIKGIRESKTKKNHFYFDDQKNDLVIAAYPG